MKHITFNYTKEDGKVSEREILAMVTPGDKYAGIDLTLIDPVDASTFVALAQELHKNYVEELQKLQAQYDLKHSYRQFKTSGMSEVTEI